jgi:hypothetical protein
MAKISAFTITCNRDPAILRAVLKRARFADQLIVVDKSPGFAEAQLTEAAAGDLADLYVRLAWSAVTGAADRQYAESLCAHDWLICLDDDEILSTAAGPALREAAESGAGDIFHVAMRHYYFGRYVPGAYDGDSRPVLYRRGALVRSEWVHSSALPAAGMKEMAFRDASVCIDHLSHPDTATFIEKTNRYTAQPARGSDGETERLFRQIATAPNPTLAAIGLLRSLYNQIDALKRWEATQPNGREVFRQICQAIEDQA